MQVVKEIFTFLQKREYDVMCVCAVCAVITTTSSKRARERRIRLRFSFVITESSYRLII